jgi:hypothetical protein
MHDARQQCVIVAETKAHKTISMLGAIDALPGVIDALPSLLEPALCDEIVVHREERIALQHQHEVKSRDRMLAPPFVVDPPTILHTNDRAWFRPLGAAHRQRLPLSVHMNGELRRDV